MVAVVSSLRQNPCAALTAGGAPVPGCFCRGGTAYVPTVRTVFESAREGAALFREAVLVSFQTSRSVDVPVPPVQTVPDSHWASSPASELSRNSVPPALVLN